MSNAGTRVLVTRGVEKQLRKLPKNIRNAFAYWVESLEMFGTSVIRRIPGYHDEPLKGDRRGQRSVRLNKSYRVIYIEVKEGIEITVIEVNKHEY